jgi:dipeptidyl aminopeptidase/acylaminoacyl peptidase
MKMIQVVSTLSIVTLLLLGCTPDQPVSKGAEQPLAHQKYSAEQFFQTTGYRMGGSGPYAFSAVNGDLIVSSDETGVYNAYRLDVESGQMTVLTASSDRGVYVDSWFPNDDRFIYQQDGNGDELTHVFVMSPSGESTDLTPGEGHKAGFAGWSSDGSEFFIYSNERDGAAFDMYRYSAADYSRTMLYENTEGLDLGAISSDGRWVVYARNNSNADTDLFLIDVAASELELVNITPHEGNIEYSSMGFTPDSRQFIYSTNEFGEFSQAWTLSLDTGARQVLIAEDWDVMYVGYSPSGRYRVSGINNDARTVVTLEDLTTGRDIVLKNVPEGDLSQVRFNRDESAIAFGLYRDTAPYDVYHMPLNTDATRLTRALNPVIESNVMVEGDVVRFASYDGLQVPGILYKPREASADSPVPALVWVHGGPGGQSRKGYSAVIQHLVNHGYAVYQINNRGSSGYGKTFFPP